MADTPSNNRCSSSTSTDGVSADGNSGVGKEDIHTSGKFVERFIAEVQQRSPIALLYLLATSISALTVIAAAIVGIERWYEDTILWQDKVETTMIGLQAGYTYGYFTNKLGAPIISRSVDDGYSESIFKERGYFVETLTKDSSEVAFYSVLVCDPSLRPTFRLSGVGVVTLNRSTFAGISASADYDYSAGGFGLNGSPFLREYEYSGMTASYRTYMWGMNASCAPNQANTRLTTLVDHLPNMASHGVTTDADLRWVRSRAIPNEYGVTAPNVHISDLPPGNIGVDAVSVSLGQSTFPLPPEDSQGGGLIPCRLRGPGGVQPASEGTSTPTSRPCGLFGPAGP